MGSASDSSGLIKYTADTSEILAQTRGWAIFRAVLWFLGVAGMLVAIMLSRPEFGSFLYMGLLGAEAVMLTVFAVRVTQFRQSGVATNMLNVIRSLKYFWIINCLFALLLVVQEISQLISVLK